MKEKIKKEKTKKISQKNFEKFEEEKESPYSEEFTPDPYGEPQKESIIKKILRGMGLGCLVVGGAGASIAIGILQIIFVWGTGLFMVYWGIITLLEGSILWGLVILFIGTPIAVGIASFLFPFWIILLILGFIWAIIKWIF